MARSKSRKQVRAANKQYFDKAERESLGPKKKKPAKPRFTLVKG